MMQEATKDKHILMSTLDKPELTGDNRHKNGQFKKGASGNPDGRPKGSMSIPDLLRRIGEEPVPRKLQSKVKKLFDEVETDSMTLMEAVMRTTMMYAVSGKPWAVQFIADRTEGKPQQTINVESHKPIQLIKTGIESFDNA